jgi:hypothetical protein
MLFTWVYSDLSSNQDFEVHLQICLRHSCAEGEYCTLSCGSDCNAMQF